MIYIFFYFVKTFFQKDEESHDKFIALRFHERLKILPRTDVAYRSIAYIVGSKLRNVHAHSHPNPLKFSTVRHIFVCIKKYL